MIVSCVVGCIPPGHIILFTFSTSLASAHGSYSGPRARQLCVCCCRTYTGHLQQHSLHSSLICPVTGFGNAGFVAFGESYLSSVSLRNPEIWSTKSLTMIPDPLVLGCILVGSRPHPNLTFTRIIHHGTGVYLVYNATRFQIKGQNVTIPCCLTFKSTHFRYFWPWLLVPHCRVVDGGRSVSFGLGQFKCLRHAACLQYGS